MSGRPSRADPAGRKDKSRPETTVRLRLLTGSDLPFADSVRALAGWNQTRADWERMLALAPDGCFLAERNGTAAGTATTTVYGPELAWIGMVLVHPDHRRHGLGRALLDHCVDHLRGRGVRCFKLDATAAGRTVYEGLGFRDEWTLTRWEHPGVGLISTRPNARVRTWRPTDIERIEELDAAAFGVSRGLLLQQLARESPMGLVWESGPGRIGGYGLCRPGAQAFYVGPVVATTADAAVQLLEALLAPSRGQRLFWDIPDPNLAAVEWARSRGFTAQRALTRMYLGDNRAKGDAGKQFALAGPEVG
jgi:GNAT superfamily N-acetyltransferase